MNLQRKTFMTFPAYRIQTGIANCKKSRNSRYSQHTVDSRLKRGNTHTISNLCTQTAMLQHRELPLLWMALHSEDKKTLTGHGELLTHIATNITDYS